MDGDWFDVHTFNRRRVYVAARSGLRYWAAQVASEFRAAGIAVESSWHDDPRFVPNLGEGVTDRDIDVECDRDESEIRRSTHVVRLSDGLPGTGANLVEWGLARAYGCVQVLVGPKVNVFDRARRVVHVKADEIVAAVRA